MELLTQAHYLFTEGHKMLQEKIIDLATGQETLKDYNTQQLEEAKLEQEKSNALAAAQAQADTAKAAAQAKLAALGLTTDDLKALGL